MTDKFPETLPAFQRMFPDDAGRLRLAVVLDRTAKTPRDAWRGYAPSAKMDEFAFRFNQRFYPFNAFRSLPDLATEAEAPTCAELYGGDWM